MGFLGRLACASAIVAWTGSRFDRSDRESSSNCHHVFDPATIMPASAEVACNAQAITPSANKGDAVQRGDIDLARANGCRSLLDTVSDHRVGEKLAEITGESARG